MKSRLKLLKKYLTHLNVLGDEGSYPDFEAWHTWEAPGGV